jgi:phosphatidylglycerophosphate synthase
MAKLSSENKFLDLSDYGRSTANFFVKFLVNTPVTPIHVTLVFGICGILAIFSILNSYYILAALLLILKSIIDAMDGELARLKKTPSYSGRYLDSVFDNILNFFILFAISIQVDAPWWVFLLAYFAVQLQGTLYNFYYVILRTNSEGGDTTSKIFETKVPVAFPYESQKLVNVLFAIYLLLYKPYDRIVYFLDYSASTCRSFPNWFMTLVSMYGLGFQLLIIAVFLFFGLISWIIPFLIGYSVFFFALIAVRKRWLK